MYRVLFYVLLIAGIILAHPKFNWAQQPADSSVTETVSPKDILTGNTPEEKTYNLRKQEFIDSATENFVDTALSSLSFTFNTSEKHLPLFLDSEGLKGFAPFKDSIQESINRDTGIPNTISFTDAIQALVESYNKQPKETKVKDLTVPTNLEIDVLKVLWVEETATASEIYAKLDSSNTIFAEELHNVLGQMVTKGFLDRKKISPSNEFNLFGFAQIELSSKNRKNKVYLYWPIVTKEKLFTYLDAQRYLALVESKGNHDIDIKNKDYKNNYQIFLEKKLYRLFE